MKKVFVLVSLLLTAFSFFDSQIAYGQILLGLPYEKIHTVDKDTIDEPYAPSFIIKDLGNSTISVSNYSSRDFKERDSSSILGYVHLNNIKHLILEEQIDCSCQSDTVIEHFTAQDGSDSIVYTQINLFQKLTRPLCSITNEFRNGHWQKGYIHNKLVWRDEQYDWRYVINDTDENWHSEKYLDSDLQLSNIWNWDSIESITFPKTISSVHFEAFLDCPNLNSITFQGTPKLWSHRYISEVQPQYLENIRKNNPYCRFWTIGDTIPAEFDIRLCDFERKVAETENYSTLSINGLNGDSTYIVSHIEQRFCKNGCYDTIYNVEQTFCEIGEIIKNSGKIFDIVIGEDCYYPEIHYLGIINFKNAKSISFPTNVRRIRFNFSDFYNLTDVTLYGYTDIFDVGSNREITFHVHKKYLKKYKNASPNNIFVAIEKKK